MSLYALSPQASTLKEKLEAFVNERCIPAEKEYERHVDRFSGGDLRCPDAAPSILERLKAEARALGVWNLFLPWPVPDHLVAPAPATCLSQREYGVLCEVTGRSFLAPEACNCSAPDAGNMEVLLRYGTRRQQAVYLQPLLRGTARSAFLAAESGATGGRAATTLTKRAGADGRATYALRGKKRWSTGSGNPRCTFALVVADLAGEGATVVILPLARAGVKCVRPRTVLQHEDAGPPEYTEVWMDDVELDASAIILGEGRGLEISRARLETGRMHHCMRAVGLAARCYELVLERSFRQGQTGTYWDECRGLISDSNCDLELARVLTLARAEEIDTLGALGARDEHTLVKVPKLLSGVIDRAAQIFSGAGIGSEFPLARALGRGRGTDNTPNTGKNDGGVLSLACRAATGVPSTPLDPTHPESSSRHSSPSPLTAKGAPAKSPVLPAPQQHGSSRDFTKFHPPPPRPPRKIDERATTSSLVPKLPTSTSYLSPPPPPPPRPSLVKIPLSLTGTPVTVCRDTSYGSCSSSPQATQLPSTKASRIVAPPPPRNSSPKMKRCSTCCQGIRYDGSRTILNRNVPPPPLRAVVTSSQKGFARSLPNGTHGLPSLPPAASHARAASDAFSEHRRGPATWAPPHGPPPRNQHDPPCAAVGGRRRQSCRAGPGGTPMSRTGGNGGNAETPAWTRNSHQKQGVFIDERHRGTAECDEPRRSMRQGELTTSDSHLYDVPSRRGEAWHEEKSAVGGQECCTVPPPLPSQTPNARNERPQHQQNRNHYHLTLSGCSSTRQMLRGNNVLFVSSSTSGASISNSMEAAEAAADVTKSMFAMGVEKLSMFHNRACSVPRTRARSLTRSRPKGKCGLSLSRAYAPPRSQGILLGDGVSPIAAPRKAGPRCSTPSPANAKDSSGDTPASTIQEEGDQQHPMAYPIVVHFPTDQDNNVRIPEEIVCYWPSAEKKEVLVTSQSSSCSDTIALSVAAQHTVMPTAADSVTPVDSINFNGTCPIHPTIQMKRRQRRTGNWKMVLAKCPLCVFGLRPPAA